MKTEQEIREKIEQLAENDEGDWSSDNGDWFNAVSKALRWVLGEETEL
jgi:hypothetical protein